MRRVLCLSVRLYQTDLTGRTFGWILTGALLRKPVGNLHISLKFDKIARPCTRRSKCVCRVFLLRGVQLSALSFRYVHAGFDAFHFIISVTSSVSRGTLYSIKDFYLFLTFICPWMENIIPNHYQQDTTLLNLFIYLFLQTLYMFQAVHPPIIRST